jgi:hypothetical protein
MIELRCLIALIVSRSDLSFRTSSPSRGENGFVRLPNGFVGHRRMKQVHAIAIGSPDDER